ncbi:response regulator [Salinarimonas soli]|nr:response regulator [Salinarimonas soli]
MGALDETLGTRHPPHARLAPFLVEGAEPDTETPLCFRDFALYPRARVLVRGGQPVELGGRAFDLLLVLLQSRGRVVTRDEILTFVWPRTTVEGSNLRFQVMVLRKALGSARELIKTIPGRGYLLTYELEAQRPALPEAAPPALAPLPHDPGVADGIGAEARAPVVIIDDDDVSRSSLERLLRSMGLAVQSFGSVGAYLGSERPGPPRCFILDVWLPGRTGLEFQADLAAAGSDVPVIFITGHADVHTSVRAMKAGAVDFLIKPLRYQELVAAIDEARARHDALTERPRPKPAPDGADRLM